MEVSTNAHMAGYAFTQVPSVSEMLLTAMTRTMLVMQTLRRGDRLVLGVRGKESN